ncbi:unnamed protein product [Effrenium voratum]|nr:unnamed protein product [Effrenium voratum]
MCDKSIASLKAATDSLAKVQQELAASKRCEADLRSQASDTKRASLVEQSTAAALHKDLAQLKQELDESKSAEQSLRTQLQAAEQLAAEAKQKELLQAKELQELQGLEQELRWPQALITLYQIRPFVT